MVFLVFLCLLNVDVVMTLTSVIYWICLVLICSRDIVFLILQEVFPGLYLAGVTVDSYRVQHSL